MRTQRAQALMGRQRRRKGRFNERSAAGIIMRSLRPLAVGNSHDAGSRIDMLLLA